eukprot:2962282-Amphidinium_carterae.1
MASCTTTPIPTRESLYKAGNGRTACLHKTHEQNADSYACYCNTFPLRHNQHPASSGLAVYASE